MSTLKVKQRCLALFVLVCCSPGVVFGGAVPQKETVSALKEASAKARTGVVREAATAID
jgi:hypothetical protein